MCELVCDLFKRFLSNQDHSQKMVMRRKRNSSASHRKYFTASSLGYSGNGRNRYQPARNGNGVEWKENGTRRTQRGMRMG